MIREAGLYNEISQAYAGIDTNQAVGVMVNLHLNALDERLFTKSTLG